jgi:hypothetical protein
MWCRRAIGCAASLTQGLLLAAGKLEFKDTARQDIAPLSESWLHADA